jgi:tryptophan synthase alpha chain
MTTGADQIAAAFSAASGRAALMPYLMGGFPSLDASAAIGEAYADAGGDLVELGVPFSDPLADGPVIHAAGTQALAAGATLRGVLDVAARISERLPVVLMCYVNPILARGLERFTDEAVAAGVSGLIVPDLSHEESGPIRDACDAAGLALVPLIAPTTPAPRMTSIVQRARGFVYTVSVVGTTGERAAIDGSLASVLEHAKANSPVPVAVGFGISTPEHAAAAADAGAEGVIVGSRLVRAATEAADRGEDPAAAVGELVTALADGLRR